MNLQNSSTKIAFLMMGFLISFFSLTTGALVPADRKYKIGFLFPFGSEGHRSCFLSLATALGQRGHEVVFLSGLSGKNKAPNVTEINIGVVKNKWDMFEVRKGPKQSFSFFNHILAKIAREMYDVPSVKEMYEQRHEFDLFIINELFGEPAYAFLEGKKYISISPPGYMGASSAILGNVLNPSYFPYDFTLYSPRMKFTQRFQNLFVGIFFSIYWRWFGIFPLVQDELNQRFSDLPALAEIEKGLTLVLVNSHFALDFPIPALPSQVEIGGMHCLPGEKLPKDLQTFIDEAKEGVIYFSLGSVCNSSTIPENYKKVLIDVFSNLKQRIIWKFEENFENLPKNILIKNWLPQQDIMAQPNVRLFITHGGLLSMQEAIYHRTPLLALPVFGDQERNAMKILSKGFGKYIFWEDLTSGLLNTTIEELLSNPKYKEAVDLASSAFRDQQNSPLETAVWWTEHVIKHKGAPHLRSPAADLTWIEYLMIDVIVAMYLVVFAFFWGLKLIFKALWGLLRKLRNKQKKE